MNTLLEPDADAQARTASALTGVPEPLPDPAAVVRSSLDIAATGDHLNDVQAAYLAVTLNDAYGRSAAWLATTGEAWHHDVWLGASASEHRLRRHRQCRRS